MDVDFQSIYEQDAERYDLLVSAEDCDGNLSHALATLVHFDGARVLDIGTGTGRVARLALERGASVVGVEPAAAMLDVARRRLASFPDDRWRLIQGDARALPELPERFDVAIAGWVFGHLRGWFPDRWKSEVAIALEGARRAVRPGGKVIVVETLGTGSETPAPPNADLAEYYAWLEAEQGFRREAIRTDYGFASIEQAASTLAFFFGDELVDLIRAHGWVRVPECTGIWWRGNE